MVTPSCKRTLPKSGAGNSGKTWVTSREKKWERERRAQLRRTKEEHKVLPLLVALSYFSWDETGEMRLIIQYDPRFTVF